MKPDVRPLLDADIARALAASAQRTAEAPPPPSDPIAAARQLYAFERAYWNEPVVPLADVSDRTVEAAGLATPLRLYRPSLESPLPLLVYLHGGGWIMGSLDTHDRIMRLLAHGVGCAVLGIDYALAPETRFPRQLQQIEAVLAEHVSDLPGVDAGRIALGGDSAGAHLALAVALSLSHPGIHGLLLYYGAYGLRDSASHRLYGGELDGLDEAARRAYRDAYLPAPEAALDPRFDLLAGPLHAAPPAFIAAAALDPLLDDSRTLAALLEAASVPATFTVYSGVLHGFLHLSRMVGRARTALDDGARWLAGTFGTRFTVCAPPPVSA